MASPKTEKNELALVLYLNTNKTQAEIAQRVGVTEKTLSTWKQEGNWGTLKAAKGSGRHKLVHDLYQEIQAIRDHAQSENRRLTGKEILDTKNLSSTIAELDRKLSLDAYIEVFEEFTNWLYETNPEQARVMIGSLDRFIDIKAGDIR